jgi:spermidine synthase
MKPWELLATARAADGTEMRLTRHDGEYMILADGRVLMSSRLRRSEEALATLACRQACTQPQPHLLIGGLGLGYTLREALDLLPPAAIVTVSELVPEVIDWNRGPLADLAGRPLDDPRVRIDLGDVGHTLRASCSRFDVVLLDVDNGPAAFAAGVNGGLYTDAGLRAAYRALRPEGTLAIWSAWDDRGFARRLRSHAFDVEVVPVRGQQKRKGPRHSIYVARKQAIGDPD